MNSTDLYADAAGGNLVPEGGIDRMITDLNLFMYPKIAAVRPLLAVLARLSFIIVPVIFLAFVAYVVFIKKHNILNKFTKTKNYIWYAGFLVLYLLLSGLKYDFGYGLGVNAGRVVLPVAAKFFGPVVGGIFGMLFYGISCLENGGGFSILSILIAAVSGIIYGIIFYRKKTRYTRCLGCKIFVGIFCNSFMSVIAMCDPAVTDLAEMIVNSTVASVIMSPISALGIYLAFRLIRLIKNAYSI